MTPYSAGYRRTVALLLMAAYTFNSMDRTIVSIVASSIKSDLRLTDTQLGLLGGTAFALLYALGGIPIARLAERVSRVNIITIALIVWSGLTALCGTAATFPQLLLIRVGVGVAEAGCSPPAHSLISDYYEPARRASALSVYSCGISLGYILAALVGGAVAQRLGWRWACAAVGLPGVATALLIKALVREPPRGGSDTAGPIARCRGPTAERARGTPPFSIRRELGELRAVAAALLLDRPILHMVLGVTLGAFGAYGFYAFLPVYLDRAFALGYARIGVIAALTGGLAVGLGSSPAGSSRTRWRGAALAGTRWFPPSAGSCRSPCSRSRSPRSVEAGGLGAGRGGVLLVRLARADVRYRAERGRAASPGDRDRAPLHCAQHARARPGALVHRMGHRSIRRRRLRPAGSPMPGAGAVAELACRSSLALATRRGLTGDARVLRLGDRALLAWPRPDSPALLAAARFLRPLGLDVERAGPLAQCRVLADLGLRSERRRDPAAERPFAAVAIARADVAVDHETPVEVAHVRRRAVHGEQRPEQQIARLHLAGHHRCRIEPRAAQLLVVASRRP